LEQVERQLWIARPTEQEGVNRPPVLLIDEPELDLEAPALAPGGAGDIGEQALRQLERAGAFNLDDTLRAWERAYIEAALKLTRGNVSQAAKLLGVNRTTLYSRMSAGEEK
jgi:DNA-binding NtrC family response regulator